jgi:hypothetical protein
MKRFTCPHAIRHFDAARRKTWARSQSVNLVIFLKWNCAARPASEAVAVDVSVNPDPSVALVVGQAPHAFQGGHRTLDS